MTNKIDYIQEQCYVIYDRCKQIINRDDAACTNANAKDADDIMCALTEIIGTYTKVLQAMDNRLREMARKN